VVVVQPQLNRIPIPLVFPLLASCISSLQQLLFGTTQGGKPQLTFVHQSMVHVLSFFWKIAHGGWMSPSGRSIFVFRNEMVGPAPFRGKVSRCLMVAAHPAVFTSFCLYVPASSSSPRKCKQLHPVCIGIRRISIRCARQLLMFASILLRGMAAFLP